MHKKQREKQHKYQNIPYQNQNFISISRKNIVPLAVGRARGNIKTRSGKETSTGHQHCGIPQKKQDTLLDDIQPNERCFEPEYNFGK